MLGRTHKIAGACTVLIASTWILKDVAAGPATYLAIGSAVAGGAIGSLIPDIDHPNSTVGQKFRFLSRTVNNLFGHRGITHAPITLLIMSYLLFFASTYIPLEYKGYGLAFILGIIMGYASHLFLDSLTVSGIPLLYPFSKKMYRIARLRTGQDDWLVLVLTVVITSAYLFYAF